MFSIKTVRIFTLPHQSSQRFVLFISQVHVKSEISKDKFQVKCIQASSMSHQLKCGICQELMLACTCTFIFRLMMLCTCCCEQTFITNTFPVFLSSLKPSSNYFILLDLNCEQCMHNSNPSITEP